MCPVIASPTMLFCSLVHSYYHIKSDDVTSLPATGSNDDANHHIAKFGDIMKDSVEHDSTCQR